MKLAKNPVFFIFSAILWGFCCFLWFIWTFPCFWKWFMGVPDQKKNHGQSLLKCCKIKNYEKWKSSLIVVWKKNDTQYGKHKINFQVPLEQSTLLVAFATVVIEIDQEIASNYILIWRFLLYLKADIILVEKIIIIRIVFRTRQCTHITTFWGAKTF